MKLSYTNIFFVFLVNIILIFTSCNSNKKTKAEEPKTKKENYYSDQELLDLVQKQTFNFFWEGAEPNSGLARERLHMDDVYPTSPKNTVTTGGSGFGLMAIIAGIERKFITREEGFNRFVKIVDFLEKADRFHGAWPHWMQGRTGETIPFSAQDNGADLVETSFMAQGLITVRQYLDPEDANEKALIDKINVCLLYTSDAADDVSTV